MKTVAIFENYQMTRIQRVNENNMVVGENLVPFEQFAEIFNAQLPIVTIVNHLMTHRVSCIEELLNETALVELDKVIPFVNVLLDGLIAHADESVVMEFLLKYFDSTLYDELSDHELDLLVEEWASRLQSRILKNDDYEGAIWNMLRHCLKFSNSQQLKEIINLMYRNFDHTVDKKEHGQLISMLNAMLPLLTTKERENLIQRTNIEEIPRNFAKVAPQADFISSNRDYDVHFYELKKQKIRVKYYDVAYNDVGHPRMIFAIKTSKDGKVVLNAKLAAIKGRKQIDMDTPLYRYPFSNVYNDGRLCWSEAYKLSPEQIPNGFLSTANNSHLNPAVRSMFEALENKTFDDNLLVRLEGKETIYDWCS